MSRWLRGMLAGAVVLLLGVTAVVVRERRAGSSDSGSGLSDSDYWTGIA
jgi:hypothetical protein